jgi:hypothetical protein
MRAKNPNTKEIEKMEKTLEQMTGAELQERYANAYITYCICSGHGKSERNYRASEYYKKEIVRRGLDLPPASAGQANGVGAV